jgi:anti-sigma B factor antagonist
MPVVTVASPSPSVVHLRLSGALDLSSRGSVVDALEELAPPALTVVLDLEEVDFCDPTGLRTLLDAERRVAEAGGALVLENAGDQVRWVLDLTDLAGRFTLHGR